MKRRIGTAFVIVATVPAGVAGCGVLTGVGGSPGGPTTGSWSPTAPEVARGEAVTTL